VASCQRRSLYVERRRVMIYRAALAKMLAEGIGATKIARELKINRDSVYRIAKEMKVERAA
jgi:DNA invertase Pin-like site-specific DNA recombinase